MEFTIRPQFHLFFSIIISALFTQHAFAAACCGGGFAAPSVIVNDDKAQATISYSQSKITDDVAGDKLWRRRESDEISETYKIEAAHIFFDRWQGGLSVPIIKRTRAQNSSAGLGDISATLGYEYLTDWDYNPWRPKGIGFFQMTAPTGKSISESDSIYQLDARGRGFWAIGFGTILTKVIGRWDIFINTDVHRSFDKNYDNSQSQGTLKPGYGGNFGIGAGYNYFSFRFGPSITWSFEDPVDVVGTSTSRGSAQRFATLSLVGSYLVDQDWAATLSYTDQSLIGNPVNTSLGRGVMLVLQKRWSR